MDRFQWVRHNLYPAAVCDILDDLGYRQQAMHQRLRPLDSENCLIVGRARTFRIFRCSMRAFGRWTAKDVGA